MKQTCVCGHGSGYTLEKAPDGRPQFRCMYSGRTWTCGLDGGKWFDDATKPADAPQGEK